MKKVILFCLYIFIPFQLFALRYNSNILCQILGEVTEDSEYVLEVNEDKSILYKNNNIVKTITRTSTDNVTTVRIEYPDSDNFELYVYEDGLLTSKTVLESNTKNVYNDGKLVFSSTDEDVSYYVRDAYNNTLLGVKTLTTENIIGSNFVYESDSMLQTEYGNIVSKSSPNIDENNYVVFNENGIEYTYSKQGLLLKEKSETKTSDYKYNKDNSLFSKETTEDSTRTVEYYINGRVYKALIYKENILKEYLDYSLDNGMDRYLFSDGIKKIKISYDNDYKTVNKIEYL